jgi:hypothetical protein
LGVNHSVVFPSSSPPRLQVPTTKPRRHRWTDRSGPRHAGGHWTGLDDGKGVPVQMFPPLFEMCMILHPENARKDTSILGRPLVWFPSLALPTGMPCRCPFSSLVLSPAVSPPCAVYPLPSPSFLRPPYPPGHGWTNEYLGRWFKDTRHPNATGRTRSDHHPTRTYD